MATSSIGSSRGVRKLDMLQKRIPENPKYKHVKPTVDTGASLTKYMNKLEDIRRNYKFRKDEIFKRMKCTTFVQLVMQVYHVTAQEEIDDNNIPPTPSESVRPDSEDQELRDLGNGNGEDGNDERSPSPSLALTDGDYGRDPESSFDTQRSTLLSVARGIGELDMNQPEKQEPQASLTDLCPYLLLDVRDSDQYNECHIISALSYPKANLSKSQNYETKEMLAFKNKVGRIIVIYDDDERIASIAATTLVQRGYDNLFMLSGGLRVAYQKFPEGLITGTVPAHLIDNPPGKGKKAIKPEPMPATQKVFTREDMDKLEIYLNNALMDHSVGSRLSKASTASSRSIKTSARSTTSTIPDRPAFR